MSGKVKLGVNIDHAATLRNARGGIHPCPVEAAKAAQAGGADSLTVHLREDRRHIRDADLYALKALNLLPLHLEMAATDEMAEIALRAMPRSVCIVPERRAELTTEGGLNAKAQIPALTALTQKLKTAGLGVSLFLDPEPVQLQAAALIGADIVELHTGAYAAADTPEAQDTSLQALRQGALLLAELGIECHAGHGLNLANVAEICRLPRVTELNIGHAIIARALFIGLEPSVREMRGAMNAAENGASR